MNRVGRPCPPFRDDIVTPRYLFSKSRCVGVKPCDSYTDMTETWNLGRKSRGRPQKPVSFQNDVMNIFSENRSEVKADNDSLMI